MISINSVLILLVLLFCCTSGLDSQAGSDGSSSRRIIGGGNPGTTTSATTTTTSYNTPLCRIVRNLKRNLQEDCSFRFNHELQCGIDMKSSCQAVSCFPDIYKKLFSAGFQLNLCDSKPSVDFWLDSRNSTDKWTHNFPVVQSAIQRVEIALPKIAGESDQISESKWYLNVNLNLDHSQVIRSRSRKLYSYVKFNATFEAWPSPAVLSPFKFVLVNDTRFQLSQLCDLTSSAEQTEMFGDSPHSYPLSAVESHAHWMRAFELTDSGGVGSSLSSQIGKNCTLKSIFQCGVGATCSAISGNFGVCVCLPGYTANSNGTCIHGGAPNPTIEPIPSPNNSTYSSALGAVLSILTLVMIAGGIIFASRSGMLSRFRSRLPLHFTSFWPFSRGTAHQVDDQVDMVDPFAHEDDDPPLI